MVIATPAVLRSAPVQEQQLADAPWSQEKDTTSSSKTLKS